MNTFKRISILALLAVFALGLNAFAATGNPVEVSRFYSTTGAFTSTITGCTTATPIVCTTSSAHNLVAGDEIRILGVVTETSANGLWYVTVPSTTTVGLYSDAGLSTASVGVGTYASGGTITPSYDVSAITGDFTLQFRLDSLTSAATFLVSIQESEDGFVSDIRTLWALSFVGPVNTNGSIMQSIRKYQLPSNRFGASGTYGDAVRIYVQQITGSSTALVSFWIAQ